MNDSKASLVSFVMPVYNSEKYLAESIESVLSQTHKKLELLIIYDKSNDSSIDIARKYANTDSRVTIIQGNGKGLSNALNIGIERSNGSYIARIDSDDICFPERIESQIKFMDENKLDICGTQSILIDENGRLEGFLGMPLTHDSCSLCLSIGVPFCHPSVLINKSFLVRNSLKYGQSEYTAAEDYDLWARSFEAGGVFGNIDKTLLKYRVLNNSASRNNEKMLKDTKVISNRIFKKNYHNFLPFLINLSKTGTKYEKKLCVKFIIRSVFKRGNFSTLKYLNHISIKLIIKSMFSEIYNFVR